MSHMSFITFFITCDWNSFILFLKQKSCVNIGSTPKTTL